MLHHLVKYFACHKPGVQDRLFFKKQILTKKKKKQTSANVRCQPSRKKTETLVLMSSEKQKQLYLHARSRYDSKITSLPSILTSNTTPKLIIYQFYFTASQCSANYLQEYIIYINVKLGEKLPVFQLIGCIKQHEVLGDNGMICRYCGRLFKDLEII